MQLITMILLIIEQQSFVHARYCLKHLKSEQNGRA